MNSQALHANNSFKVMFSVSAGRCLYLKIFWFHCWSSDFVCQTFCPGIFPWYDSWSCDFQESNGDKWLVKKPRSLRPLYFRTRHLMQVEEQCNAWGIDERFGKAKKIRGSSRVWQIECKNECQNVLKRKCAEKKKMDKRQWILRVCRPQVTFFHDLCVSGAIKQVICRTVVFTSMLILHRIIEWLGLEGTLEMM